MEKWTDKETFESVICYEICADLFPGFEYGNRPTFEFEELCEFGTELVKRLHLHKVLKGKVREKRDLLNENLKLISGSDEKDEKF